MNKQKSIEDQLKIWVTNSKVPNGPGNLVFPNSAKVVSLQKSNKHRKRSSKSQTKDATQLPSNLELKDEPVKIVPNSLADELRSIK